MASTTSATRITIPTIASLVPIAEIMTRDPVCVRRDMPLASVLDIFLRRYIGCVPVVDDAGAPLGMITKRDLLDHVAACTVLACSAGDAMLPLAFTLDERATVGLAAGLMAAEDVHHVPVVAAGRRVVGVVSTLDIVRWLARNDGFLGG